jgi:hypothetical protein
MVFSEGLLAEAHLGKIGGEVGNCYGPNGATTVHPARREDRKIGLIVAVSGKSIAVANGAVWSKVAPAPGWSSILQLLFRGTSTPRQPPDLRKWATDARPRQLAPLDSCYPSRKLFQHTEEHP